MTLGLGMKQLGCGSTKFVQAMILDWPWLTKHQLQIFFLMHFNWKYIEKLIFPLPLKPYKYTY